MANNSTVEQQNVTINFSNSTYIPAKYVFEMDDRPDEDQTLYGAVRIRKYPAFAPGTWSPIGTPMNFDQGIRTLVTAGTLQQTTEIREKEVYGTAVVSGDSELTLAYPVVSGLEYAMVSQCYDIRGRSISVNMGFDSIKNALVFSRPCYAVVRFFYRTQYQVLRYYPNIFNDFETYYMPDPSDYGQLLGFIRTPSTVDAVSPIVFAINPPEGIAAEFELYRVESTALAKEDGLWERPPGWPEAGTYPSSEEEVDPSDSLIEIARTHEIGYFSLLNNTRRMESYQSSASDSLPLDFGKDMKTTDTAGMGSAIAKAQKVQNKEQLDKYTRLLNRAPKMRTVHYDVPIGLPYSDASAINAARGVVRTVSSSATTDSQGNTENRSIVQTAISTYRIKIVVKAPTRPSVSSAVVRNQSNMNTVDFNVQAQRINTMLSMIWEGVDWKHLRQRIKASYDTDIYEVTFDSSFPST